MKGVILSVLMFLVVLAHGGQTTGAKSTAPTPKPLVFGVDTEKSDQHLPAIAVSSTEPLVTIVAYDPKLTNADDNQNAVSLDPICTTDPKLKADNSEGSVTIVNGRLQVVNLIKNVKVTVGQKTGNYSGTLELQVFNGTAPVLGSFSITNKTVQEPLDENVAVFFDKNTAQIPITYTGKVPTGTRAPNYRIELKNATFNNTTKSIVYRINCVGLNIVPAAVDSEITVTITSIGTPKPVSVTSNLKCASKLTVVLASGDKGITLKQGTAESVSLTTTPEVSASTLQVTLSPQDAFDKLTSSALAYTLKANSVPSTASIVVRPIGFDTVTFPVQVSPSAGAVVLSQTSFVVGQPANVSVKFKSSDGVTYTAATNPVVTVNPANLATVTVQGPGNLLVQGNQSGSGTMTFQINGDTVSLPITVNSLSGLAAVKADLQVMADQTAVQLFGKRFSDEFYVVQATLTNTLSGADAGKSILVYSSTFEAGIALMEKPDKVAYPNLKRAPWTEVTESELEGEYFRSKENDLNQVPARLRPRTLTLGANSVTSRPGAYVLLNPGEFVQLSISSPRDAGGSNSAPQGTTKNSPDPKVSDAPNFTWSLVASEDPIAISSTGFVSTDPTKPFKKGNYVVQAKDSNGQVVQKVIIALRERGFVSVDPTSDSLVYMAMDTNSFGQIKVNKGQTLSSSDQAIATVTPDGIVNALKEGTCLITITTPPPTPIKPSVMPTPVTGVDKTVETPITTSTTSPGGANNSSPDGTQAAAPGEKKASSADATISHVIVRVFGKSDFPPGVYYDGGELRHVHTRLRYRPYGMDMALSVQDDLASTSHRTTFFQGLNVITGIANGLVSVAKVNTWQKDEATLATSLLTPLLQQFWPDRSNVLRLNLQNYLMNPLEEIAPFSSISKYLIFPKLPIGGMLPGKIVRISAIDTQSYNVQVGIVTKSGSTGSPPSGASTISAAQNGG